MAFLLFLSPSVLCKLYALQRESYIRIDAVLFSRKSSYWLRINTATINAVSQPVRHFNLQRRIQCSRAALARARKPSSKEPIILSDLDQNWNVLTRFKSSSSQCHIS